MKILVTGGAGFIGGHIVDAYLKAGHKVAVLDDLVTGSRRNLNPKAKFYKADVRDVKKVRAAIAEFQPDVINHHAAIAEVVRSMRDPMPTLEVNVLGTANLLTAFGTMSRSKNKKFIFASTGGALYGEPRKLPAGETTLPGPLSVYGLSKQMAEDLIRFYAREFSFPYLIFRYANVYGPRQNPKGEAGVVAIFGGLLKVGKQPAIFGDGKKTRDYVYVGDIVRANLLGLTKGKNVELNLGLGREVQDRKVFDEVAAYYGYSKEPKYLPHRKGEVKRITLDAKKARRVLGWKPGVDLEDGIKKALKAL